jgi:hypothetical protein
MCYIRNMGETVSSRLKQFVQLLSAMSAFLLAFGFGIAFLGLWGALFMGGSSAVSVGLVASVLLAAVLSGLAGYATSSYEGGKPHCRRWMRLCGALHILVGMGWVALFLPSLFLPPDPYPFGTTTGRIVWLMPGVITVVLGLVCLLAPAKTAQPPTTAK